MITATSQKQKMASLLGAASIPFIACISLLAAMVLQILSFAAPYWAYSDTEDIGLWRRTNCVQRNGVAGCYRTDHLWYYYTGKVVCECVCGGGGVHNCHCNVLKNCIMSSYYKFQGCFQLDPLFKNTLGLIIIYYLHQQIMKCLVK